MGPRPGLRLARKWRAQPHKNGADPEAPISMHSPPVRAGVGLAHLSAIVFAIMLVAGHCFSVSAPRQIQG